jgi:hypothetical protein
MPISAAVGDLIHDWGFLLVIGLFFGTGEVLTRILDGRRKLAQVRGQRDGYKLACEALQEQVQHYQGKPTTTMPPVPVDRTPKDFDG